MVSRKNAEFGVRARLATQEGPVHHSLVFTQSSTLQTMTEIGRELDSEPRHASINVSDQALILRNCIITPCCQV